MNSPNHSQAVSPRPSAPQRSARTLILACLATAMALAPLAAAQPLPVPPKPETTLKSTEPTPPKLAGRDNAALAYYQAVDMLTREQWVELQNCFINLNTGELPGEEACALLLKNSNVVSKIMDATKIDACEWGTQYEDGFGALLPYLGHLRKFARVLAGDARRCIVQKDLRGAAERYAAMYRLSIHSSRDGSLICSLVGEAIRALVNVEVRTFLNNGQLDVESARSILNGARLFTGDDPLNYLGALDMEKRMAVDWVQSHYTGPDAGKQLFADMMSMQDDNEDPVWAAIQKMDGPTLAREVEKTRPYYDDVRKAWAAADGEERLVQISKDVEAKKYGSVTVAMAGFERAYRSMSKGRNELNQLIKDLESFVRGEYVPPAGAQETVPGKSGEMPVTKPAANPTSK